MSFPAASNHWQLGMLSHAGGALAQPEQGVQAQSVASASTVAAEAWCTVTDRLRRLRTDLEVSKFSLFMKASPSPHWSCCTLRCSPTA